jgi:hypothetical protein
MINTDSECKPVKKIELFNTIDTKPNEPYQAKLDKLDNNIDDNIMVYKLIGLFIILISIALIYKKY